MKELKLKIITASIFLFVSSQNALADEMILTLTKTEPGMTFLVVQDHFMLDNSNVKSAHILNHRNGSFAGLQIVLKPFAIADFERITNDGVGKRLNLVLNNKVVSTTFLRSPIGKKFIIASITRDEAQTFINILNTHRKPTSTQQGMPIIR